MPVTKEKRHEYNQRRYYKDVEKIREYNRNYQKKWRKNHPNIKEYDRLRALKYREKEKCRRALRWAVEAGTIIKKNQCEWCSGKPPIEAHHSDYSKPYEVIWLCRDCHGKTTRHLKQIKQSLGDE